MRFPFLKKITIMKKILFVVLSLCLMAGSSISCKKKKDKDTAPGIPSADLVIDFSNFNLTNQAVSNRIESKGIDDSNWKSAAQAVAPWKTLVDTKLSVPANAFKNASGKSAAQSGSKWEWNYTVSGANAKLIGEPSGDNISWNLSINDVQLIIGTSNKDGNSGECTLMEGTTSLVKVNWKASPKTITYTGLSGALNGKTIEYGTGSDYNFYYNVDNNTTNIEWNTKKDGRVKSSADGTWKKWNSAYGNE